MPQHATPPALSVIVPIRNRSGVRLENCLRSLRWQDVDPATIEIILSDYGSTPGHAASIDALAKIFEARVVRTHTHTVWNRSRALNIGIQSAQGEYVFCTDADMIFQPNFLSTLLQGHTDPARAHLLVSRCHDLPESVPEKLWSVDDYQTLLSQATVRQTSGTGACQCARRGFFHAVRGYDEAFKFWGAEDNDMVSRATAFGLTQTWIHDHTSMLHQWHPTLKNDRRFLFWTNRLRYKLTQNVIVKNKRGWGLLP